VVLAWPVLFGALFLAGGLLVSNYEGGGEALLGLFVMIPALGFFDNLITILTSQSMPGAYSPAPPAVERTSA